MGKEKKGNIQNGNAPSMNDDFEIVDLEEGNSCSLNEETRLVAPSGNALERFVSHFINESNGNPIPFGFLEGSLATLEGVGGSGGIYILPIVSEFTKNMPRALAWNFILTNPLSNVLFLINAADELADSMVREIRSPSAIKDLLKLPTKKALAVKYFKMTTGALVCSIPFGAATYLFPLPGCDDPACLGLTISHTIISNTVLHAIAWDILLQPNNWIYRLPSVPFEIAYSRSRKALQSSEKKETLRLQTKRNVIYQKYRGLVSASFSQATQRIVQDYAKSNDPTQLRRLTGSSSVTSVSMFVEGNTYYPSNQNRNALRRCLSHTNTFLRTYLILLLGAILTIIAGLGWEANPIYIGLQAGLSLPLSILAGVLPSYSTAVLFAFYGAMVSGQIYDYLTTWTGIRSKFSLEAQLYPKTFAVFLVINIYVALFAFAGAEQLIRTVFGDEMWDDFRPYMEYESIPVFQILSFVPLLNLFNTFVRKSVAKFGCSGDHKLAARLLEKTNVMLSYLDLLDGEKLIDGLNEYDDQQLTSLGIDPDEFRNDLGELSQLEPRVIELPEESTSSAVRNHQQSLIWSNEREKTTDEESVFSSTSYL